MGLAVVAFLALLAPVLRPVPGALHWERDGPFDAVVTVVDATGDPAWAKALRAAAAEWTAGVDHVRLEVRSGPAGCDAGAGPATVTVCVHPTRAGSRGATFRHAREDDHMDFVVVHMADDTLRRRLACHELGHALGLVHRPSGPSCMVSGTLAEHPDAEDYRTVTAAHAHMDQLWP